MNTQKVTKSSQIAFGGMMAALALVLMSVGGVIPVFTYVTPMVCALVLQMVLKSCGGKIAWAWYGAVSILGFMLCSDKESALVFVFIGYYPIVKPWLERTRYSVVGKAILFNLSIFLLYYMLIHLIGIDSLSEEFAQMGSLMLVVLIVLGNITFFLLDRLLTIGIRFRKAG